MSAAAGLEPGPGRPCCIDPDAPGLGLVLVGSRFDLDTRRLLEILARNRLVSRWLELEGSPEAERCHGTVPAEDLPIVIVPGGPRRAIPGAASY